MRICILILLLIAWVPDALQAAHLRGQAWQAERGILETIRIEPRLPAPGQKFTARLTGNWPEKDPRGHCWGPLEVSAVEVHAGNRVQLKTNMLDNTSNCDEPPAKWSLEVEIPATAWTAVDEQGFLLIENLLYSGINMLTGVQQVFDLRLGTHEVPAFLGSGIWVSPERPFEGLMVEQQGNRVLFYSLGYDRDTNLGDEGEPVWQMVSGEMYGSSALGRSYRYDWPVVDRLPPEAPPGTTRFLQSTILVQLSSVITITSRFLPKLKTKSLTNTRITIGWYLVWMRAVFLFMSLRWPAVGHCMVLSVKLRNLRPAWNWDRANLQPLTTIFSNQLTVTGPLRAV